MKTPGTRYIQHNLDYALRDEPSFSAPACVGCGALKPHPYYPDSYEVRYCPNCGRDLTRTPDVMMSDEAIVASVKKRRADYEDLQTRPGGMCDERGCQVVGVHGHFSWTIPSRVEGGLCAKCGKKFRKNEAQAVAYENRIKPGELKDGMELARVAYYHPRCLPKSKKKAS